MTTTHDTMDGVARGREREGSGASAPLRRVLLALVFLSALGLTTELVLLEHFESWQQWLPLALLGIVLASCIVVQLRPGRGSLRLFQGIMTACVVAGLAGIYLHYSGNAEFELERDPQLRGLALLWESVRGATPTLAAGALSQLGLLGLAFTFRHPLLQSRSTVHDERVDIHHTETP